MPKLNLGICLDGPLQGEEHEWEGDKHTVTGEFIADFHTPGNEIATRELQPFIYEYQEHIAGGGRIEGFWIAEGTPRTEVTALIRKMFGRTLHAGNN